MTQITAPAGAAVAGLQAPGGNVYDDRGRFDTDDPAVIAYCEGAGYGVGGAVPAPTDAPDRVDARNVDSGSAGSALRDAAVDPRPGDFLPPTNAGQADPHGPLVVAPGIHAVETQVVRPGVVHVDDLEAQEAAETAQAVALLVENRDVLEATPTFGADADRGPLELSDPGSAELGAKLAADDDGDQMNSTDDPADFSVAEVNAYLAGADEDERARVLDAERSGKDRKGVTSGPHAAAKA